jgi:hypothetical protein
MATQVTSKARLNGYVLGVEFVNGNAETDSPTALSFFRQSDGYTVADEKPAKAKSGSGQDS